MTVHSPLLCSLLLGTLVLSGCKMRSQLPQAPKESTLPCWVQSPKQANQLGFVGTAAPLSATPNGSELASRTRALKKLAAYYNIQLQRRDVQNVTHDQPMQALSSGHTVYYSTPFNTEDTQYSYVSFEPLKTSATCAVRQCDFVQCQLAWLCDNDTHSQVLGVSYYTASPHEQLQISERNATTVASFLMQAQVNAKEYLKQRAISYQGNVHHEVNYNRNGEVDARGTPTRLALHQSCQYGSTLIGQYKPVDQAVLNAPVLPDINDMTQQGKLVLGAFGEDGTMTSDNLLSTAIRLAIQDALIELAKNKGITIETQVAVTQHKGHYLLESSEFTINEHVSGELIDLKIQYKNDVPVIYVWLLEK